MTYSGQFDREAADAPLWLSTILGTGMPPRRLEIAPRGYGRPWYRLLVGRARVTARPMDEEGNVKFDVMFLNTPDRKRVGLRRWWKAWRAGRT